MKLKTILVLSAAAVAGLYAVRRRMDQREPAQADPATPEEELEHRMKEFLDGDAFTLYIQPVVELSSGGIRGGEVLARLNHPERGLLMPDEFLPVINRMGLQVDFDLCIFRKSCAWLRDAGGANHVSVNFSRKTLSEPDIARQLAAIADQHGVAHECMSIEVTEVEKENDIAVYRRNLTELREMGFQIFLDDFGSGVTSIADLNQCVMDIVKIDRSVLLAAESPDGSIILKALTEMARALGVDVVCEGIETEEQERLARECGCRYGQGMRYSRPVSADAFLDMIEKRGCND